MTLRHYNRYNPRYASNDVHNIKRPMDLPPGEKESYYWRRQTCKEAQCNANVFGWRTVVPAASPQYRYIKHKSGRNFTEKADGDLVIFTFYPGQTCFDSLSHDRTPTERNPQHNKNQIVVPDPERWLDDLQESHYRYGQNLKEGRIANG